MNNDIKYSFCGTRIDATCAGMTQEQLQAHLNENVKELDIVTGKERKPAKAIITESWVAYTSTFNPHGWGVPRNHVYAVARYKVA